MWIIFLCFCFCLMSWWARWLTVFHFPTSLSFSFRYCVTNIFGDPLLRPLQHANGVQQAWARLSQAPSCCWGHLALFLVLDSAPLAGLEQLQYGGGGNKLLCVLDGSDSPVTCLHHLSVHFLPGSTCPGDDLLLWQAAVGSETGRETAEIYMCLFVCDDRLHSLTDLYLIRKEQSVTYSRLLGGFTENVNSLCRPSGNSITNPVQVLTYLSVGTGSGILLLSGPSCVKYRKRKKYLSNVLVLWEPGKI